MLVTTQLAPCDAGPRAATKKQTRRFKHPPFCEFRARTWAVGSASLAQGPFCLETVCMQRIPQPSAPGTPAGMW
jgi:hypothetical protein